MSAHDVVFVNTNAQDEIDPLTPLEGAVSGTRAAAAFLSAALAAEGLSVGLLSGQKPPRVLRDVSCYPLEMLNDVLAKAKAIVIIGNPLFHNALRRALGDGPVIVCWAHDFFDHYPPELREAFATLRHPKDRILCVSAWHMTNFAASGMLDRSKIAILHNALPDHFLDLCAGGDPVSGNRQQNFVFSAVPYKGLEVALEAYRLIEADIPFDVYSSFSIYPPNNNHRNNPYWETVIRQAREIPGVRYHGAIPQKDLAAVLRSSRILFYPNNMPETSGISVMEAMAAGMYLITTDVGALPETTAGFARLVKSQDGQVTPADFAASVRDVLAWMDREPEALEDHLQKQLAYVQNRLSWTHRAATFRAYLRQWAG